MLSVYNSSLKITTMSLQLDLASHGKDIDDAIRLSMMYGWVNHRLLVTKQSIIHGGNGKGKDKSEEVKKLCSSHLIGFNLLQPRNKEQL